MRTGSKTRKTETTWPPDTASGASAPAPRQGPPRATRWIAAVVAVALTAGLLLFISTRGQDQSRPASSALSDPAASIIQTRNASPHSSAATMIARVLPSVVNVRVVQEGSARGAGQINAEGSGVILTSNGLILTNNHVVQDAVHLQVVFTSGQGTLVGTVVGTDPNHDLAVIKVDATGLTPLPLGESSDLQLGETVYAIGFPLDLGVTVTRGIVSGLDRNIAVNGETGVEHLAGLIQTDAAINPGNSGGALVDASGRLVAINTAGVPATSADNVGFAIAIDEAVPVVKQILTEPAARAVKV
jgi:putative serine protease PepD